MIKTRVLSKSQIGETCGLLYDVYIEQMGGTLADDTPSQLKVELKNGRKILTDRFVNNKTSKIKQMITELESYVGNSMRMADLFKALEIDAPIFSAPVYWHNVNGVVLGLNEHCLKAMGAAKYGDIIGRTPYEFYPKEVAEHILNHNEHVMRTSEIMSQ